LATAVIGKNRILDTAAHLFHERGYKSITMRDIAAEVGIRQPSLYYHFPQGKEELFVEVTRQAFKQHQRGLTHAIASADPDLQSQLLAVSEWFASRPPLHLLSMMHTDMPELSDEHRRHVFETASETVFQPIAAIFSRAATFQEIHPVDPHLLAGTFLAMLDGFAQAEQGNLGGLSRQEMARQMIPVLLNGLRLGYRAAEGDKDAC
jgi:AcrR family transcriptional regulator